jgi:hypothetical protein
VITPFGLRHIWLMRELQSASAEFDLRGALLGGPATPLQTALRGYFLKSRSGVFTYVLRVSDRAPSPCGFAQARADQSGLAWNVVRLAPVLDHSEDAATVWYRLLLHLCIAAGERRVQRLLVCLPEGSAEEDVFRQASFVAYCHEQVFWRQPAKGAGRLSPRMLPLQSEDCLDVRRLWYRVTPRPVLQAEQSEDPASASLLVETTFSDAERRYVLRSHGGEIWGYLHTLVRPRGAWLRLMVHPDAGDSTAEILGHALAVLEDRPQPLYCAVREYEGGIKAVLEDQGFAPGDAYSLLVKHTTVRVTEPRPKLVPALEKRVEVAPTVSRSETGDH